MGYSPEHYLANKEKYAAKSRAWREANKQRASENRKRYYEEHKDKELKYSTNYNRLKKIGLNEIDYQCLLEKQKAVCAICYQKCTRALAADHCHNTGRVRGLLCNNCNRGLGHFKDNPELLYNAIEYLKQ